MKYKLPKDIAHDFNVSQKTVYNYLTKYGDKISTKKEYGKTFVSVNDFQSVLQKVYTNVPSELDDATKKEGSELVWTTSEKVWKVTESTNDDYEYILSKNENLEKVNRNLEDQVQKYAIMLKDEKNEKRERQLKHEDLQKAHLEKIESFWNERIKYIKKYDRLLIFVWVLIALAAFLILFFQFSGIVPF